MIRPTNPRIQEHLEITKQHADMVEQVLNRLGSGPSTVKSAIGSLFGGMSSIGTGAAADEMVKNGLQDFAAENFEIASYQALIAAAQQVGAQDVAQVCQRILQDEQEMAQWLQHSLPTVVQDAMSHKLEDQLNK